MLPTETILQKNYQGFFRLLETNKRLLVPANTNIKFLVTSVDVLHSWTIPSFGIKIDACPGRLNEVLLFLSRAGIFFGQCSEICGVNHGFMPVTVVAAPYNQYNKFLHDEDERVMATSPNSNRSSIFACRSLDYTRDNSHYPMMVFLDMRELIYTITLDRILLQYYAEAGFSEEEFYLDLLNACNKNIKQLTDLYKQLILDIDVYSNSYNYKYLDSEEIDKIDQIRRNEILILSGYDDDLKRQVVYYQLAKVCSWKEFNDQREYGFCTELAYAHHLLEPEHYFRPFKSNNGLFRYEGVVNSDHQSKPPKFITLVESFYKNKKFD